MKPNRLLIPFFAFWITACIASPSLRADEVFTVDLNTSALTTTSASAAGPFSLAFQMVQGDPANATNTATISDFNFGGGSVGACPADCITFGNETGDATGTVGLSTSDGFEALIQGFTPGDSLSFLVDLTTVPNSGAAPDTFAFSILDSSLFPIPTQDPDLSDSLLTVSINSTDPAIDTYATDPSTGTNVGNVSISMGPATIGPPPTVTSEPSSLLQIGCGLISLAFLLRRRQSPR